MGERWGARPVAAALAILAGLAVTGALLALGGYDPGAAAAALVRGSVGSPQALSTTLVRTVPLILTGLAVALAFRAGVWNIGAEGQLYAGAVAAAGVGIAGQGLPGWILVPALLCGAALAGAAWAAVPALMRLRLGVGEVITTILMNFVALHLTSWLVQGPLREGRGVFPQTDPIATAARLPVLPGTRLHAGLPLALLLAVALWAFFRWTRAGFRIRVVGASPEAARLAARMDVERTVFQAFLGSGALAGLAGGVQVAGVTWALYENLSPGWGYTAIAVALLAGLHPLGVALTAAFFGAVQAGGGAMQRSAGVPAAWAAVVEAAVVLAVLALHRVGRRRG